MIGDRRIYVRIGTGGTGLEFQLVVSSDCPINPESILLKNLVRRFCYGLIKSKSFSSKMLHRQEDGTKVYVVGDNWMKLQRQKSHIAKEVEIFVRQEFGIRWVLMSSTEGD